MREKLGQLLIVHFLQKA